MFPEQDMETEIKKIKHGDSLARERFLESCKPFIYKVACKYSRKNLEWGRDDELAIGLIAFNEAIDRFCDDFGVPFLAYSRNVMRSRLVDHYRRENRNFLLKAQLPLQEEGNNVEFARSWGIFQEEEAAREREEEIREFEELLNEYGVSFEDLVKCSPRHRDTRRSLMLAAWELAEESSLFQKFTYNKKLPLVELEKKTGIGRKTLERGRKYIVAMTLLIHRREDFLYLASYLKMPVTS
ncbi:sigma-70 family RNA polymerase sigma factor [Pelotomaculum terephthalicicum JT]|uniref:sigma-70 family RNA polymerase sigma factor n=1 Tax=Pelotomaculum TaxID=191373 RepID=UPI0009D5DD23|nr:MULTISPECIES: sigma-70 family RNA polymerase sigma factor [Pelotomaculum]MCG9968803.1 sigma-70 family RNA polymerase sigma factor [Pelotomaculum terephthalicicum JT]OPX86936.1 MAG: RNA polymerase sigma factor SigI [Pelotomaculum sp. PtaB.Bin117]OPY63455.1 MAG: RNA polymerase sigma factor SigI [Pelotomaculum sp. PtaU1.Bin065]